MKLTKHLVALSAAMAFAPTTAASAAETSRYERAVGQGYCPIGLVCPSYDRNVEPVESKPGHPAKLPVNGGPPMYTVKAGDTLWGIAVYYFGDGKMWSDFCTVPRRGKDDPKHLGVGDIVSFC